MVTWHFQLFHNEAHLYQRLNSADNACHLARTTGRMACATAGVMTIPFTSVLNSAVLVVNCDQLWLIVLVI